MKARKFILTTGAVFALVVPAAHAAASQNRLYQTQAQTVLYETNHQMIGKARVSKSRATEIHFSSAYQTLVQTVLFEASHQLP
jgi:hypothetical protein